VVNEDMPEATQQEINAIESNALYQSTNDMAASSDAITGSLEAKDNQRGQ
jgi:hypothetical protein